MTVPSGDVAGSRGRSKNQGWVSSLTKEQQNQLQESVNVTPMTPEEKNKFILAMVAQSQATLMAITEKFAKGAYQGRPQAIVADVMNRITSLTLLIQKAYQMLAPAGVAQTHRLPDLLTLRAKAWAFIDVCKQCGYSVKSMGDLKAIVRTTIYDNDGHGQERKIEYSGNQLLIAIKTGLESFGNGHLHDLNHSGGRALMQYTRNLKLTLLTLETQVKKQLTDQNSLPRSPSEDDVVDLALDTRSTALKAF